MRIDIRSRSKIVFTFSLIGFLLTEAWYFINMLWSTLSKLGVLYDSEIAAISVLYFTIVALFVATSTDIGRKFALLANSGRWDIFIYVVFGCAVSISLNGLGKGLYANYLDDIGNHFVLLLLFGLPCLLLVNRDRTGENQSGDNGKEKLFLSDVAIKSEDEDRLGISGKAERFAKRVVNSPPKDMMVFGVDAPWGIGKTSFMNLCIRVWEEEYGSQTIIYQFNPADFESHENLTEKFADGLVARINETTYIPELGSLISRYSRALASGGNFSLLGFRIPLTTGKSVREYFKDVFEIISRLDARIIVIVDDLDRVPFPVTLQILHLVRNSFLIPNINYVLCYDTQKIRLSESNNSKSVEVSDYLEKYVGAKIGIFVNGAILARYLSNMLNESLEEIIWVDRQVMDRVVGGVSQIFNANDYSKYQRLLGNVRKLKKLLNIILYIDLNRTDLTTMSTDISDLIHLLLIYINYPSVFRDIYISESGGLKGDFSVVRNYYASSAKQKSKYSSGEETNPELKTYIKGKGLDPDAKFLLYKVFDIDLRAESGISVGSISQEKRESWACFNGEGGDRNLEQYLRLIVDFRAPDKGTQYRFYLQLIEQLESDPKSEPFHDSVFNGDHNELGYQKFWQAASNTVGKLSPSALNRLVDLAIQQLPDRALIELEDMEIGYRKNLIYVLLTLLDKRNWAPLSASRSISEDEKYMMISDFILGARGGPNNGLIKRLTDESRKVLGIYDALVFRLYCGTDRANNLFNVSNSLIRRADPKIQLSGSVLELTKIGQEEISQLLAGTFKQQYIDKGICYYTEINNLTREQLVGIHGEYLDNKLAEGALQESSLNEAIAATRSALKSFIFYQLAGNEPSSERGVGCGIYSLKGASADINSMMNSYLFNLCFDPRANKDGYRNFLDFCLINTTKNIFEGDLRFTKADYYPVSWELMCAYWKAHKKEIEEYAKENNLSVTTYNFSIELKDLSQDLFSFLDERVEEIEK